MVHSHVEIVSAPVWVAVEARPMGLAEAVAKEEMGEVVITGTMEETPARPGLRGKVGREAKH